MYQTQTITRRTIKNTETRLKGLSSLRGLINLPPPPSNTPPIASTSSNGSISLSDFWNFINGSLGQLKIDATQFAEGMNRLFYGLEPGCTNPTPGIPVVANSSTPRFCSTSVAGMIERCRLYEAGNGLSSISTQFQQRMNSTDPAAPYIKRWWDEYGRNNVSVLSATIATAGGTCGITGEVPKLCTEPLVWSAAQLKCVPRGTTEPGGGISSTVVIGGAIALVALMMFMRR